MAKFTTKAIRESTKDRVSRTREGARTARAREEDLERSRRYVVEEIQVR